MWTEKEAIYVSYVHNNCTPRYQQKCTNIYRPLHTDSLHYNSLWKCEKLLCYTHELNIRFISKFTWKHWHHKITPTIIFKIPISVSYSFTFLHEVRHHLSEYCTSCVSLCHRYGHTFHYLRLHLCSNRWQNICEIFATHLL